MTQILNKAERTSKLELDSTLRKVRTERYALQSVAREILPDERVSKCLRQVINASQVEVWKHKKTDKAFYNGLTVCGSVWHCPVCAAKISEKRKEELKTAFEKHKANGGYIAMLTLTFSHTRFDNLKEIVNKFNKAKTKFTSGKRYNNIRKKMGMIGTIRVMEVTYGENGYHPHLHLGLFYKNEVNLYEIENEMFELWYKALDKQGLKCDRSHGIKLENAENADQYLSKHGTWSLEQELSKSHIKKGKQGSLTPFDFLRWYLMTGQKKFARLFKEYAETFKGKRQIQWSRGLKQHFEIDDKDDKELANEKVEQADLLGLLNMKQWKFILKNDLRSKFLNLCELEGFEKTIKILFEEEKNDLIKNKSIDK